jgi:hypothetical protein
VAQRFGWMCGAGCGETADSRVGRGCYVEAKLDIIRAWAPLKGDCPHQLTMWLVRRRDSNFPASQRIRITINAAHTRMAGSSLGRHDQSLTLTIAFKSPKSSALVCRSTQRSRGERVLKKRSMFTDWTFLEQDKLTEMIVLQFGYIHVFHCSLQLGSSTHGYWTSYRVVKSAMKMLNHQA